MKKIVVCMLLVVILISMMVSPALGLDWAESAPKEEAGRFLETSFYDCNFEQDITYYSQLTETLKADALLMEEAEKAANEQPEYKEYCTATINDNFDEGTVLVSLFREISEQGLDFSPEDFGIENIQSVSSLMKLEPGEINTRPNALTNYDNFHQILNITLKETGKEKVLEMIRELEELSFVQSADPNYIVEINDVPNDTYYSEQYALELISAPQAWNITKGSANVRVGVIDTGVANHVDLNANLGTGYDFYNDNSITTDDVVGHGTRVAGIIGAVGNNGIGVAGVNWNVTIIPLQVLNTNAYNDGQNNYMSVAAQVDAINYCQENNIPIVNMSLGGYENSSQRNNTILNYTGVVICSAGNDANNNDQTPHYPSNTPAGNVISVAATDANDQLWEHSNYGANSVDIAAPGVSIYTTNPNNEYVNNRAGTSLAAPFVTGAAALLLSHYPNLNRYEIISCILHAVDQIPALVGKVRTGGRLNIAKALDNAASIVISDKKLITGDFNGDGKDDIMAMAAIGANRDSHTRFLVNLSQGNKFSGWQTWYESTGVWNSGFGNRIDAGDINGDGKDDVIGMFRYSDGTSKIFVYLSTGTKFTGTHIWYEWPTGAYDAASVGERFAAGDYNGDGKCDIAVMYRYSSRQTSIFVQYSNGSAFTGSQQWLTWPTGAYDANCVAGRYVSGDFNGDGKCDLAVLYEHPGGDTAFYTYLSQTTSFTGSQEWQYYSASTWQASKVNGRIATGDFNGDGKDDLAMMYRHDNGNTMVLVQLSTVFWTGELTFESQNWYDWFQQDYDGNNVTNHFSAGDYNGDGKSDIVCIYNHISYLKSVYVHTSTGSQFNGSVTWWGATGLE